MSKSNWLAFLNGNRTRAGASRRARRRKAATSAGSQLLEERQLLTVLTSDQTIVADNVSQFAPGAAGKVGFDKFVGAQFNTGEHSIGGFALGTGVEAKFGLRGRVGFDVGAFINPGSVTATSDLRLTQDVPDQVMPGPVVIDTAVVATNGVFETTSPSLGGYADLVAELSGIAQLEWSVLGLGDTIGGRFGLDLGQELFAINRDDDRQIRVMGETLAASGSIEKETSRKPRTALKLDYSGDASHVNGTAWSVLGGKQHPNGTKDPSIEKRLGSLDVWSPKISVGDVEDGAFTLLRGYGEDDLASLKFDVSPIVGQALGIGAGLGTTAIDFGIGRAEITTVKLDVGPELAFLQTAEVRPKNLLRYDFPSEVGVFKNGGLVRDSTDDPNKVTSVIFDPVSDEISLDFTGAPIEVSPSWHQTLELRNDVDFAIQLAGRLEVGKIDLTVDFPWPVGSETYTLGPLYSLPFQQNLGAFDVFADTFPIAEQVTSLPSFIVGEGYEMQPDDLVVTSREDRLWDADDFPQISLRQAIRNANLNPGPDVIELGAGVYDLMALSDSDGSPDLEITDDLTIIGVGDATIIDATGIGSRVFDVAAGVSLTLDGMDVKGGSETNGDGGAIRNLGTVTMVDAWVGRSTTSGRGGGIFNAEGATLNIAAGGVYRNTASGTGGGIHNEGSLDVTAAAIYSNTSSNFGGGGIYNVGDAVIAQSAVYQNTGTFGGGLENHGSGYMQVGGTTVSGNTATTAGGGINNVSSTKLVLASSTVTDNHVDSNWTVPGSGIRTNENIEFFNSIISGNRADNANQDISIFGAPIRAEYNVVGWTNTSYFPNAAEGGTNVRDATPELSPLGYYGGATQSHVPLPNSPAVGNGAPAGFVDQRDVDWNDGAPEIGSIQMVDSVTVTRMKPRSEKRSTWQSDLTLQDVVAFFNAAKGDEKTINLVAGTYEITGALVIGHDDVAGRYIINGQGPDVTVIDGTLANSSVIVTKQLSEVEIFGLTVTGGREFGRGPTSLDGGGGIANTGDLALTDVVVEGNHAIVDDRDHNNPRGGSGGGILNTSSLSLNRTIVRDNMASHYGGGISGGTNGRTTVTITDSVIEGNQAAIGGGVYHDGAIVSINSTTIANNIASGRAGGHGFRNGGGGGGGPGLGGGIAAFWGTTTLNQVTLSNNEAVGGAGGNVAGGHSILESVNDFYAPEHPFGNPVRTGGKGGGIGGGIGGLLIARDGSSAPTLLETYDLPPCCSQGASGSTYYRGGGGGAGIPLQTGDFLAISTQFDTHGGHGQRGGGGGGAGATGVKNYGGGNPQYQGGGGTKPGGGVRGEGGIDSLTLGAGRGGNGTPTRGGGGGGGGGAGGGIFLGRGGTLIINSSTITENTARGGVGGTGLSGTEANPGEDGVGVTGGIYHLHEDGGSIEVANSIIAGNTDSDTVDADMRADARTSTNNLRSNGHNLIGWLTNSRNKFPTASEGGTDIRSASPDLAALADNGGFGMTHVPLYHSPAVDSGATSLVVDQRGDVRGVGGIDDIGAVESHELVVCAIAEDCSGNRTLERALVDAALIPGHNTIVLQAGTYLLESSVVIDSDVTIVGAGANLTTIDGSSVIGDLFVVDDVDVTFEGVTILGPESGRILDVTTGRADIVESELVGGENGVPAGWPTRDGGLILTSGDSVLNITRSTLSGGKAHRRGGALALRGSTVATIHLSTLHGNDAVEVGDAIFMTATASLTMTQSTVSSGSENYDGVAITKANENDLTLHNSVIEGRIAGFVDSLGYNLIGNSSQTGGLKPEDITNVDPMLGELADHGGSTRSVRPQAGSPLIDAGEQLVSGSSTAQPGDQRGSVRVLGEGPDIGAVERAELLVDRTTDDTLPGSLRRAILDANQLPWAATINVEPGIYELTRSGSEDDGLLGDLDIKGDITIAGESVGETIIVATNDRAFDVASEASLGLSNLTLRGGTADVGGNIRNAGSLQLSFMELANGDAEIGGGVANLVGADMSVRGSLLIGNSASTGGAIHNAGRLSVLHSTFSGNAASNQAGAVFNTEDATGTLSNVTIRENTAPDTGGVLNEDGGQFELLNTIVAGNSGTDGDLAGQFFANHSFIGAVSAAADLSGDNNITGTVSQPADPRLGPLTDNGGFTRSYRPMQDSPVIDAGLDQVEQGVDPDTGELVEDGVPADQRGLFRDQRDDTNATNAFDIGSVEAQFDFIHRIERESSVTIQESTSGWTEVTDGEDVVRIINPYRSLTVIAQDGDDTLEHYRLGETSPEFIINIDDVIDTGDRYGDGGDNLTLLPGSVWNSTGIGDILFLDGEIRGTGTISPPGSTWGYETSTIAPEGGPITVESQLGGAARYEFSFDGGTHAHVVAMETVVLGSGGSSPVYPELAVAVDSNASEFVLIDNQGAEPVSGRFDGLPEGSELQVDGRTFNITYSGGDGNDVVLRDTRFFVDDDVLRIHGTESNDRITMTLVGDRYVASGELGDEPFEASFAAAFVNEVWIDAKGGNDNIDGRAIALPTTMLGGSGNDTLRSGSGDDILDGGDGADSMHAGAGEDTLHGGAGHDRMQGHDGNDWLTALSGDNRIWGGWGDDTVSAGDGNDSIVTNGGDDSIVAGGGNDTVLPSGGNDTIYAGAGDDFVASGSQNDLVFGGEGNDELRSGNGADTVYAGDGNDSIVAGRGPDVAFGESGNDTLSGNNNRDVIVGGTGNDFVGGNRDRDVLIGGTGRDTLGAGGSDDLLIAGSTTHDADVAALKKIMAEWNSGRGYEERVQNLRDGSGAASRNNGDYFLVANSNVNEDASRDELTGGSARDWFFASVGSGAGHDLFNGLSGDEIVDELF